MVAILTPSTWRSNSVGLKRAGDPDALSRVAGLEFVLGAVNGSWPVLNVQGGVHAPQPQRMGSTAQVGFVGTGNIIGSIPKTIGLSVLGSISVPGQSVPAISEVSDWSKNVVTYSGQFDITMSRLTNAILIDVSDTTLRMCSGTTTKRTTTGTAITEAAAQTILPKWVAWHETDGYHTALLASGPIDLSGIDQPWLMIWWGSQSHWCDTNVPLTFADLTENETRGMPHRYAFQADCPLLLTFENEPDSISQNVAGGFDLAWTGNGGKVSTLPLYGRQRLTSSTTEAWGTVLPSDVQSRIQTWYPRTLQFPTTVTETYAYNSGTDVVTLNSVFTWTTIHAGGTKYAPIRPITGIAIDTLLGITCSETIVNNSMTTVWGPITGCVGVDEYDLFVEGLAEFITPRGAPGGGSVPSTLQDRLDDEIDKLVAQSHWQPWGVPARAPNGNVGGDVYYADPANTIKEASELLSVASSSQRTALLAWLAAEITSTTPLTTFKLTATTGTPRGRFGLDGSYHALWNSIQTHVFLPRRDTWVAHAMSRYYQESGVSIPAGMTDDLLDILQVDMSEHAWDLGLWLQGYGPTPTGVENANRLLAGLIGLAWFDSEQAASDAADTAVIWGLYAITAMTRIAMVHYPRWLESVGLVVLPTDRGSAAANAAWLPTVGSGGWNGYTLTYNWATSSDDPRYIVKWDQYQAWLDTSTCRMGWTQGAIRAQIANTRSMTYHVVKLLEMASHGELSVATNKRREMEPHEWVPMTAARMGQEAGYKQPADSYWTFLTRAWTESVDKTVLEVEAGHPWLTDGGDLMTMHKFAEAIRAYAGTAPPRITNIVPNALTLNVGQKLELVFWITSDTERPDEKYDPSAAIPNYDTSKGVTVKATLTHVPTGNVYVERCFRYGAYTRQLFGARDFIQPDESQLEPAGQYRFGFRATLKDPGVYTTSISLEDADNDGDPQIVNGPNITAVAAPWKGLARVAQNDSRYFEREDGSLIAGFGTHFTNYSQINPIAGNGFISQAGVYRIEPLRIWISFNSAFGAYNHQWRPNPGGGNALVAGITAPPSGAYLDRELAFVLTQNGNPNTIGTLSWNGCAAKPSTTYQVKARIKCEGTFTATNGALPRGFTFKAQDFFMASPWLPRTSDPTQTLNSRLMTPVNDTGGTWQEVTATWVVGANRFPVFHATMENCSSGTVYVDEITVREDLGSGNYGPNIVPKPSANMHQYVSQHNAYGIDKVFELAEQAGTSMIIVVADKDDVALACWDETTGNPETPTVNNFYGAADGSMTKSRWLQRNWWEVCRARWGYSDAVFAWQPMNEGSPSEGRNFLLTRDFCDFMHGVGEADPPINLHMATASFWSQVYPKSSYWNNVAYNNADFVNFHKYFPPLDEVMTVVGGSNFTVPDDARNDTVLGYKTLADQIGAGGSQAVANKPAMLAETALTANADTNSAQNLSADVNHIWLQKLLWMWLYSKVVHINWFNTTLQILTPERRQIIQRFVQFVETIPLNNGNYVDAEATASTGVSVVGQKDPTNNVFHLWGTNNEHTHGTAVAGTPPTPRTGNFFVPGITVGIWAIQWTNTYTGATILSENRPTDIDGNLTLPFQNLTTDIAVRASLVSPGLGEAMGLGLTTRNEMIGREFGNRTYTPPATHYLAFVTDTSDSDPTNWPEVSTSVWTNYVRTALTNDDTTWDTPVDGNAQNAIEIDCGTPTISGGSPIVKGFVLWSSLIGGSIRASMSLPESGWRTIENGKAVEIEIGALDLTLLPS